jgi:malonyl-CoA O-methyltransferase
MTAAVNVLDGYRRWAPSYSDETAISYLEDQLVSAMTPPLCGLRLLDAGCGTGRRLRYCGASSAAGLDASREMLAAGVAKDGSLGAIQLVVGDVRAMPFDARAFDVVWCRLVLGHLPRIDEAYAEFARVADIGATVIVSDFHPAAHEAGHRRSFRAGGQVVELEHHVHRPEDHVEAAHRAGLALNEIREAEIGNDVREFYDRAGKGGAYPDHLGLPVVLALSLRRER